MEDPTHQKEITIVHWQLNVFVETWSKVYTLLTTPPALTPKRHSGRTMDMPVHDTPLLSCTSTVTTFQRIPQVHSPGWKPCEKRLPWGVGSTTAAPSPEYEALHKVLAVSIRTPDTIVFDYDILIPGAS